MKRALIIACIWTSTLLANWTADYHEGVAHSSEEKLPLLLFFHSSDFSGLAMQLKDEVLSRPEFVNKLSSHFALIELDYPMHQQVDENRAALKEQFQVESFPTLIVLDDHEQEITRLGYVMESPEQLADDLLFILAQHRDLTYHLTKIDEGDLSYTKGAYLLALELGREEISASLLDLGCESEDRDYFQLEKYRYLVHRGEPGQQLREKLSAEAQVEAALIDFQALSENKLLGPDDIVVPLLKCLAEAKCAAEKRWRLEMMVAQVYLDADMWEEALIHAERAQRAAPQARQGEIAHSLKYMHNLAH